MPIATSCPNCHAKYTLADNQLDKTVLCRGCQKPFLVSEDVPSGETYKRPGSGVRPRPREDDRRREDYDDRGRDRDRDSFRDRDRDRDRERDRDRGRYEDDYRPRERPRRRRAGIPAIVWVLVAVGGGIAAMVLVILVIFFAVGGGRVNMANYNRIQRGMSEAQVIAIMGRPHEARNESSPLNGMQVRALGWKSGRNKIAVAFFNDRLVTKVAEINGHKMQESGF